MIDCYCDYDAPIFYNKSTPKARKQHVCEECSVRIQPGEAYECVSAMWSEDRGYVDTFRTCSRCVALRTFVKNSVPCFCWAHGNMLEDARETVADAYDRARDEVRGLWFGYARRLVAIHRHKAAEWAKRRSA